MNEINMSTLVDSRELDNLIQQQSISELSTRSPAYSTPLKNTKKATLKTPGNSSKKGSPLKSYVGTQSSLGKKKKSLKKGTKTNILR